ncbi:NPAS4 (predicted) [Pycnogonum litorale]
MLANNTSSAANVQMCSGIGKPRDSGSIPGEGQLRLFGFEANKSTKGASKLRRDLINSEISNLRDLLPLPSSTRQRLSQLQLMALVCVYVRKSNYFQQVFRKHELHSDLGPPVPNFGFSKALSGFLMMTTQNGKLLYISDNAAEYLGHSMEDLLIHGDSVYDIIEKQDHQAIQTELLRSPTAPLPHHMGFTSPSKADTRIFLCRMNVSRNARRQMRFGDQKVVLVEGHFVGYLPLCSRNEPVFLATCTPVAMPETRECVVQGSTNVFTSIHNMDMNFAHLDKNGELHLGYTAEELQGKSWYQLLHWDSMKEAQTKHRLITTSEQERSCIMLLRIQKSDGKWIWVHVVLQVKEGTDNSQQPIIVSTNQVLNEREAALMRANSWLYHYYSVHSKIQYGLTANTAFDTHTTTTTRIPTAYYPPILPYHHTSHVETSPMSPYLPPPPPPPPPFANINGSSQQNPAAVLPYSAYHNHHHHHHHHHNHSNTQGYSESGWQQGTKYETSSHETTWKSPKNSETSSSPSPAVSVKRSATPEPNSNQNVGSKWRRITPSNSSSSSSSSVAVGGAVPVHAALPQPVTVGGLSGQMSAMTDSRVHLRSLHQRKLGEREHSDSDTEHQSSVTPTNTEDVASWISLSASVNDEYGSFSGDMNRPPFNNSSATADTRTDPIYSSPNGRSLADPLLLEKTQTFARLVQQYGPRLDDQTLKNLERTVFGDALLQELHALGQYLRQGPNYPSNSNTIDLQSCLRVKKSREQNFGDPRGVAMNDDKTCYANRHYEAQQKSPGCESKDSDYLSQTMSPSTPRANTDFSSSSPSSSVAAMSSPYYSNHYMYPMSTTDYSPSGLYNMDRGYHCTSSSL